MAEPGFSIAAARPVVAGHVVASRVRRAVRLGASQNIMPVRSVSTAGYPSASFVDHCHDGKPMSHAVKLVDVIPDQSALRVMPWARADTVPRIDRVWALRAEVSRRLRRDPQIGSFARAIACNEESHRSGCYWRDLGRSAGLRVGPDAGSTIGMGQVYQAPDTKLNRQVAQSGQSDE